MINFTNSTIKSKVFLEQINSINFYKTLKNFNISLNNFKLKNKKLLKIYVNIND